MYKPSETEVKSFKYQYSSFTYKVLEEEKKKREELLKLEEQKKELQVRRIKYGRLVKDVY